MKNMLICVDVGNTTIAFGFYQKEQNQDILLDTMHLETKVTRTIDEYGHLILENIRHLKQTYENQYDFNVRGVMISSVVPALDIILEEAFKKYVHVCPDFVHVDLPLGMHILIDQPKQLGADLLVGAYMAQKKYTSPLIVVDMGTATTFVAVNSSSDIIGVVIYPGVVESFQNLIASTSLLESTKLSVPKHVIGKNTEESIQSGMIYASSCVVDGMVEKIKKEMKEENIKTILTGGVSKYIAPFCKSCIYDEFLLIEGLKEIYYQIYK